MSCPHESGNPVMQTDSLPCRKGIIEKHVLSISPASIASLTALGLFPSTWQPTLNAVPRISLTVPSRVFEKDLNFIVLAISITSSREIDLLCLMFFSFLRSRGGSLRARMMREEAVGTTETAACLFWMVSLTVTRRPFCKTRLSQRTSCQKHFPSSRFSCPENLLLLLEVVISYPVTSRLRDIFSDLLGRETKRTDLGGKSGRSTDLTTGSPEVAVKKKSSVPMSEKKLLATRPEMTGRFQRGVVGAVVDSHGESLHDLDLIGVDLIMSQSAKPLVSSRDDVVENLSSVMEGDANLGSCNPNFVSQSFSQFENINRGNWVLTHDVGWSGQAALEIECSWEGVKPLPRIKTTKSQKRKSRIVGFAAVCPKIFDLWLNLLQRGNVGCENLACKPRAQKTVQLLPQRACAQTIAHGPKLTTQRDHQAARQRRVDPKIPLFQTKG